MTSYRYENIRYIGHDSAPRFTVTVRGMFSRVPEEHGRAAGVLFGDIPSPSKRPPGLLF